VVVRLFPRKQVQWAGRVHERPICSLPVARLSGYLEHHTYTSLAQWEGKAAQYSRVWAEQAYAQGRTTTPLNATLHAGAAFVKAYVLQLGFLEGWHGFFAAYQHSYYTFMKYLKLLEKQTNC